MFVMSVAEKVESKMVTVGDPTSPSSDSENTGKSTSERGHGSNNPGGQDPARAIHGVRVGSALKFIHSFKN